MFVFGCDLHLGDSRLQSLAIQKPHEIIEFTNTVHNSKRRAYIHIHKETEKTIPLVAFFKQRKGIWEPQSIHPILKEAKQLKNISVNQYLEEKVRNPHESEVAEILKF